VVAKVTPDEREKTPFFATDSGKGELRLDGKREGPTRKDLMAGEGTQPVGKTIKSLGSRMQIAQKV